MLKRSVFHKRPFKSSQCTKQQWHICVISICLKMMSDNNHLLSICVPYVHLCLVHYRLFFYLEHIKRQKEEPHYLHYYYQSNQYALQVQQLLSVWCLWRGKQTSLQAAFKAKWRRTVCFCQTYTSRIYVYRAITPPPPQHRSRHGESSF